MKHLSIIYCSFVVLTLNCFATSPTLELITQPLFWRGSANQDNGILYAKVPKIMNHTYPPLMVHWYQSPTRATNSKDDLNLISVYGVKISVTKPSVKGSPREVTVDISESKKPKGYLMTIRDAGRIAAKAIRSDFSDSNLTKIFIYDGKSKVAYIEQQMK